MYPELFLQQMKNLLGDNYSAFNAELNNQAYKGVRINTIKIPIDEYQKMTSLPIRPSPFCEEEMYISSQHVGVGKTLDHVAGLIYAQEPSASCAVAALNPQPGDFVLDLCASPGGKSTQIGARLKGQGLIWSNEYVSSRLTPLVSNIERMGIANSAISSAHPTPLCRELEGCFDRVLVDAPCSGEGMMRKDPKAAEEWSPEHVQTCAARQYEILCDAALAVRNGGVLVYSTCTFSVEENEMVIQRFLKEHPNFQIENTGLNENIPQTPVFAPEIQNEIIGNTTRIFPQNGGEGHFVARMKKNGDETRRSLPEVKIKNVKTDLKLTEDYIREYNLDIFAKKIRIVKNTAFLLPQGVKEWCPFASRLGVPVGKVNRNTFKPEHHWFMAYGREYPMQMTLDDTNALLFLKGQELDVPMNEKGKGWCAVLWNKFPLGFGKVSNGKLKNHYPKGLRWY